MIQSYVVHLVVDVVSGHDLVGVVEDVQTGERRRFLGPEELVSALTRKRRGTASAPVGEPGSPSSPTEG